MSGPSSRYSRDLFCTGQLDAAGNLFLSEREPFRYVDRPDNVEHVASAGDTWASLADRYFPDVPDAASLLWGAVADFQPVPAVDPTVAIVPGSTVYVFSRQTLETEVFNEARRADHRA